MANSTEHLIDIDRETGLYVQGWPRIRQSIITILTTRLRTRLMRRWWGSDFLNLQDKPANQIVLMNSIVKAADAINEYEPEFKVRTIIINEADATGEIMITVEGVDLIVEQQRRVQTTL